jgi:hypothetical protein
MEEEIRDAVSALVEHVAAVMQREDPERHSNPLRIPSIGEAVATANYRVEAVHKILSVLAPLEVVKAHVRYADSANSGSDLGETALGPIETQLQSGLTEAAINDTGLRPVFGQLVEVAMTSLFASPPFQNRSGLVCGLSDAKRWWRRDPGVAEYVQYMYNVPIVFPRIQVEYREANDESDEAHEREARYAWRLCLIMPLVSVMSEVEYVEFWRRLQREDGLRNIIRLDPCEFRVGRLFAHIKSLGIGTSRLESELGFDIQIDDERLESLVVDMFWTPRNVHLSEYETDERRTTSISFLWGAAASGIIGDIWPDIVAPQLQFLNASMCGAHPQVERRTKLPFPRILR